LNRRKLHRIERISPKARRKMSEADRRTKWPIPTSLTLGNTVARAKKARSDWENWYQAEPLLALGVSLGVGIFLGWLVKRR
jgi:ElaB/YqjD/DUF883 family membrane-anchored ribosome-binding protein